LKDLKDGIGAIYVWPMLGWQEIKQRYRRSALGPFWLTLSTGTMVACMGPLYGRLLGQDMASYFPYLGVGLIVWFLIANLINESCSAFISAAGYIHQLKLPLTVHVMRVVYRNLIVFAHNLVIVALILLFYRSNVGWSVLLAPLAVLLVAINGVWVGILLGMLCARFRDVPQVVASLMQVAFFLTPIMWKSEMLGKYRWAADFNPLTHYLEIVRAPLVSGMANLSSWIVVLVITAAGYLVTIAAFSRFRARIAYWV
jgi:ABC-type polysaccharide/polyol phosphate export permease